MNSDTNDAIQRAIQLPSPPARVWRALTTQAEFETWFRVTLDGPFVVGREIRGQSTYPGYEHCRLELLVTAMEPERYFAFSWHPYDPQLARGEGLDERTLVEFRLEPCDGGTRLAVRESGFSKITASWRDESFRLNTEGWDAQIENIRAHLAA